MNIVVSGGTGSGKTTLINVLSSFIPEDERTVTIEDAAELQLKQRNVVRLETKKPTPDSPGVVTIRDCVVNALRMRPERIVVGECRSGETPVLQDLFKFVEKNEVDGKLVGAHEPGGLRPKCEATLRRHGFNLPAAMFMKGDTFK